jgi:hypothetical protein
MSRQYQLKLQQYLQQSTLTPGVYAPSDALTSSDLAAVMVDGKAIILTGSGEDKASIVQAQALSQSKAFRAAMKSLDISGQLTAGVISGLSIDWPSSCEAVVASTAGEAESGDEQGDLQMISLYPDKSLTTLLCVNTELARIIDPDAPAMDDGKLLTEMTEEEVQILKFH